MVILQGLAISAFARGYQVLNDEYYLGMALKAARFIRANVFNEASGRLQRSAYRECNG